MHEGIFKQLKKSISCPEKGDYLFKAGDTFDGFYVLCQGSAKAVCTQSGDNDKIVGFYHPNNIIGLCGFGNATYQESVQILSYSRVFKISKDDFNDALHAMPEMAGEMIRLLSDNLVRRQHNSAFNMMQDAEVRLMSFLNELYACSRPRSNQLELPMTRVDIANYLGIAVETLCRLIKGLTKKGLIEAHNRHIVFRHFDNSTSSNAA
ncbi:Crp/Fnr family transcriptional regulator [Alteromonas sp. CYL-A6]|uniref:Crp/Fnr family transcriptional regulator n=1 Tax=Alteromonas nitratireducens TaxID=3390813 RepID=UPI0034AFFAD2